MKVGITRWPGGPYLARRQGKSGKHITFGPVQINWHSGLRAYLTWPIPLCAYLVRR